MNPLLDFSGLPRFADIRPEHVAPAIRRHMQDFLSAIRTRGTPKVTAESATMSLAIIERAYAARTPMKQPWVEVNR